MNTALHPAARRLATAPLVGWSGGKIGLRLWGGDKIAPAAPPVMVALVATIHVFAGRGRFQDVDARDKPEHDEVHPANTIVHYKSTVANRPNTTLD